MRPRMRKRGNGGLSEYWLKGGTYKARVDRDVVRKVVDRERLKGITKGLEEGGCQRRG